MLHSVLLCQHARSAPPHPAETLSAGESSSGKSGREIDRDDTVLLPFPRDPSDCPLAPSELAVRIDFLVFAADARMDIPPLSPHSFGFCSSSSLLLQLYLAVLVSSEVTVTLYRLPVGLVS